MFIQSFGDWFPGHSDTIQRAALFSSNTVVLAGEIFRTIPRSIPNCARAFCSYAGVIGISYDLRNFQKVKFDFTLAFQHQDDLIYTVTKVALQAIDIFLLLSSFSISVMALSGLPAAPDLYYRAVMPLVSLTLYPLIAFDFIDFFENRSLLKQLEELPLSDQQQLCQDFLHLLDHKGDASPLARRLLRQLNSYRLDSIREEGVTIENLKNNLNASVNLNVYSLALKVYGYTCLWFNGKYPGSLTQATTAWSSSALFTSYFLYDKYFAS